MSTVGRQGMRRPSAMGGVGNVFRPGAAAHGWRERMVARARNGRLCTVRASCNIRVFDQALRAYPNNRLTVRRMKPDGCTGTAPLCPNQSSFATGYSG